MSWNCTQFEKAPIKVPQWDGVCSLWPFSFKQIPPPFNKLILEISELLLPADCGRAFMALKLPIINRCWQECLIFCLYVICMQPLNFFTHARRLKIHLLFILFEMQTHFSVKLRAKMHSTVAPNKKKLEHAINHNFSAWFFSVQRFIDFGLKSKSCLVTLSHGTSLRTSSPLETGWNGGN